MLRLTFVETKQNKKKPKKSASIFKFQKPAIMNKSMNPL